MYVKLFASLYQGTLRGNSHGILVFTNMLAHCDRSGVVDMHPCAIADETGLTNEEVIAALRELESPDPESRTPEEEGRRIVRLDEHRSWGWRVVNYAKYRAIRNEDDRREANRIAVAKHRARKAESSPVITGNIRSSVKAQAEAEAEEENTSSNPAGLKVGKFPPGFDAFWKAYPRKVAKDAASKAFSRRKVDAALLRRMIDALEAQKRSHDWLKDGGQFIPHPATWLNQGRWCDEATALPDMRVAL